MTEFSNILKECRTVLGLTQYAIAKNINIQDVEYAMYENAMRLPKKEKYERLNKHYNFEQFENAREAIADKISDFLENADMYDVFVLEWKLEHLKRKK